MEVYRSYTFIVTTSKGENTSLHTFIVSEGLRLTNYDILLVTTACQQHFKSCGLYRICLFVDILRYAAGVLFKKITDFKVTQKLQIVHNIVYLKS